MPACPARKQMVIDCKVGACLEMTPSEQLCPPVVLSAWDEPMLMVMLCQQVCGPAVSACLCRARALHGPTAQSQVQHLLQCHAMLQGMCSFNLLQDKACCPMCQQDVKPVACALVGCAWMYDGRKVGRNGAVDYVSSDWQVRAVQANAAGATMLFYGTSSWQLRETLHNPAD